MDEEKLSNKRIVIKSSKAKVLFQEYEKKYENKTKAARNLKLRVQTYSRYSKARVNSYPEVIIKKVCRELKKPLKELITGVSYEPGKISEEYHERVLVKKEKVVNLFKNYQKSFKTITSAAESLDLKISTYLNYSKGKVKTYPKRVLEKLCNYTNTNLAGLINNELSLKDVRGSMNRHFGVEGIKKFNGSVMTKEKTKKMMNNVRKELKKKYGEDCYKYLSKLSLRMREEMPHLYDEAKRIHKLLIEKDYTLDELIQTTDLTEENTIYVIDELVKDNIIKKKRFTYSFYLSTFTWREKKREINNLIKKPYTTNELIKLTGLQKKKLKLFLYKLKKEREIMEKFDSRETKWFKKKHENSFNTLTDFKKQIINFLYYNPRAKNKDMRDKMRVLTEINHTTLRKRINYNLSQLEEKNYVKHEKQGRSNYYTLTNYGKNQTPIEEEKKRLSKEIEKIKNLKKNERMKQYLLRKRHPEKI